MIDVDMFLLMNTTIALVIKLSNYRILSGPKLKATPIGLDKNTRTPRLISDINSKTERGLNCNCICPSCHDQLMAKMGEKKADHFAHYRKTPTQSCFETAIHILAKHLICINEFIQLPHYQVRKSNLSMLAEKIEVSVNYFTGPTHLESTTSEFTLIEPRIKPDVWTSINFLNKSYPLAIEIAVTHFVDSDKELKVINHDLSMVEVDLSKLLKVRNLTTFEVERELNNINNWRWINLNNQLKSVLENPVIEQIEEKTANRNEYISVRFNRLKQTWINEGRIELPKYDYPYSVENPRVNCGNRVINLSPPIEKPKIGGIVQITGVSNLEQGVFIIEVSNKTQKKLLPIVIQSRDGYPKASSGTHLCVDFVNITPPAPNIIKRFLRWGKNEKALLYCRAVNEYVRVINGK